MFPRTKRRLAVALFALLAMIGGSFFMPTFNANATGGSGGGDYAKCTWEWNRSIPQSHQEYKYSKTIPGTDGVKEYKYKKSVEDVKVKYQYQKQVKGEVRERLKGGSSRPFGSFDWEWYQPPTWKGGPLTQWSFDDVAVLESGPHNATSNDYLQGEDMLFKVSKSYQYVKNGVTEQVSTGSHWEYTDWTTEVLGAPWVKIDERWKVEPTPEQTVLYKDGAWTTDTPGDPWVKIDERTVQDDPIVQGPVRSANEPDRGDYPNVPWVKDGESKTCVVHIPATPRVQDPCGPDNATWNVPADTDKVTWELKADGHLWAYTTDGNVFTDETTSHDYGIAPDSGEKCPPEEIAIPATPSVQDPCGPDNATWNVPADTETLDWELLENGHLVVTIKGDDVVFTDGTTSHDYGTAPDSGEACPPSVVPVPAQPDVTDPCGPNNASWVVPANTDKVTWELKADGHLWAYTADGYVFEDETTSHDYGIAPDSGEACPPTEQPADFSVDSSCGKVTVTNNGDVDLTAYFAADERGEFFASKPLPAGQTVTIKTDLKRVAIYVYGEDGGVAYVGYDTVTVKQNCGRPHNPPHHDTPNPPAGPGGSSVSGQSNPVPALAGLGALAALALLLAGAQLRRRRA